MNLLDYFKPAEDSENSIGNIRVGMVSHVYPEHGTAEVKFPDIEDGEFVTNELPVIMPIAGAKAQFWHLPAVDDQVLCVFLSNSPDVGFILGGFYAPEVDTMPENSADNIAIRVDNGDLIQYDKEARKLTAKVASTSIELSNNLVTIGNGGEDWVALSGKVKNELDAIADMLESIKNAYNSHTHTVPNGESSPTTSVITDSYAAQSVAAGKVKAE